MGYNSLNQKVEAAIEAIIDALSLSGVTVNQGGTQENLALPYVICSCPGGGSEVENLHNTGIFNMEAQVMVSGSLDDLDAMSTHTARVQSVYDALITDDANATFDGQATDFGVYEITFTGSTREIEDRKITDTLEFELVCQGSDIT